MRIIDYLYGEMTLGFANKQEHIKVIDLIAKSGANYRDLTLDNDLLVLRCPAKDGKKLCALFESYHIDCRIQQQRGLYLLLRRLFARPGLCMGAILFCALLFLSTQFVFDIRITGNEILTDEEIRNELAENGFICGSFLPSIDIEALCNRIVLRSDTISWISVNMLGTIAQVEIKEQKNKIPNEGTEGMLSCLVAKRDGVIVGFDCGSGTIAVNVGQTVKKGEVLVTGVLETQNGTYFQNANGRVRARTNRTFIETIPKTEQVTVGYERIELEKQIIFLGKTIKVFTKGRNSPPSCDTIKEEIIQLSLTDDLLLPIYQKTVYAEIPITENVTYTEEQAKHIATERINLQVDGIKDLLVLSAENTFTETEDSYILTREMTCIEDIAQVVPIKTN